MCNSEESSIIKNVLFFDLFDIIFIRETDVLLVMLVNEIVRGRY